MRIVHLYRYRRHTWHSWEIHFPLAPYKFRVTIPEKELEIIMAHNLHIWAAAGAHAAIYASDLAEAFEGAAALFELIAGAF